MHIFWLVNPVNLKKKKRMFSYDTAMTKYKELDKLPASYTNKKKKTNGNQKILNECAILSLFTKRRHRIISDWVNCELIMELEFVKRKEKMMNLKGIFVS